MISLLLLVLQLASVDWAYVLAVISTQWMRSSAVRCWYLLESYSFASVALNALPYCTFYHIEDGWRRFAFLHYSCARRMTQICLFNTRLFPCTVHLIMQYIEPVSEWSCWWMFIETWPHSELTFRHRASSI